MLVVLRSDSRSGAHDHGGDEGEQARSDSSVTIRALSRKRIDIGLCDGRVASDAGPVAAPSRLAGCFGMGRPWLLLRGYWYVILWHKRPDGPFCENPDRRRPSHRAFRVPGAPRRGRRHGHAGGAQCRVCAGAFTPPQRPDVAVIDINLPDISGFELARRLLVRDPDARILMFSMNDDPMFAAQAIECGAKGYVSKSDDPSSFLDRHPRGGLRRPLAADRDGAEDRPSAHRGRRVSRSLDAARARGSAACSPRARACRRSLPSSTSPTRRWRRPARRCARSSMRARPMQLIRIAVEQKIV